MSYNVFMLKRTRKTTKGSTITIRLSDRTRYGLDLVCRLRGESISSVAGKAINMVLDGEGIDSREPGELQSKLDRLWSPDPAERLMRLYEQAPELLTEEERDAFFMVQNEVAELDITPTRESIAANALRWLSIVEEQVGKVSQVLDDEASSPEGHPQPPQQPS